MAFADQFEVIGTPPFKERFTYSLYHSIKVTCVICGQRGFMNHTDSDSSWTRAHRKHVRCTCGKAVSYRGIGSHRAARKRHGTPCPEIGE